MKLLSKNFYLSEDVAALALQLLGKVLICESDGIISHSRIVETEAYRGPDDKACHAYNNRRTDRTEVMYAAGGCAYVYISYGMHHLLNVVTAPQDKAHAVLIRAVEPILGLESIQQRRGIEANNYLLTGGPGKICQGLGIDKSWNRLLFYDPKSPLRIADDGFKPGEVITTPRVGMSVHVGPHAHWPWRCYLAGNQWVSRPLKLSYSW
ncbi:MAG: DNA-3-methyladenine glycosylase [Saprospiraceae bacterium]|jgi:DNA-3-methyladenine glycosylase|nr:DNA-3-methyladenine glycosylase [Saprospiraceae bacterium]MBP9194660.1 DNA-3-methyladenine glycosylase [Saprospiraceae bacterium]